jgi:hypothetical protein
MELKYAISKPLIDQDSIDSDKIYINKQRALRQHNYYNSTAEDTSKLKAYFSSGLNNAGLEVFSFLHSD